MISVTQFVQKNAAIFQKLPNNIRAILIMFIAMMCFSTMAATIKELGQTLHVTVIVAIRQGFMVLFLLPPLLKSSKGKVQVNRKDLFLIRAFLTFFSILAGLTAIINLPLATATTLSFTRTFFITVFAVLILKETVGVRRIGALIVGFAGILIIARPFDMFSGGLASLDNNIILALIAAATIAANQVIIRIHTRYDHPTVMVTGQALLIGLAMIPLAYYNWVTPTWTQVGLIALTGILASFAQWLMVHAFKWTQATTLAPFDYVRLLFSTAFGWFIFNEFPDGYTWVGASVIFASTFYIMRREAKLKKPATPQTVV